MKNVIYCASYTTEKALKKSEIEKLLVLICFFLNSVFFLFQSTYKHMHTCIHAYTLTNQRFEQKKNALMSCAAATRAKVTCINKWENGVNEMDNHLFAWNVSESNCMYCHIDNNLLWWWWRSIYTVYTNNFL